MDTLLICGATTTGSTDPAPGQFWTQHGLRHVSPSDAVPLFPRVTLDIGGWA